ncbi:flagellar hook-associated protein 3 [Clostridium fermenticellae]|uniref:Flagellin n=1 Tax=Clostridium fermenticellae TaxID=2068654 RepID=A0A386H4Q6_9CLOT|nr:flagellin [Clostridium fermenticellae]AYD40717.1 flagellar hook-associated protein 3 [Clostridium fermenticellae]
MRITNKMISDNYLNDMQANLNNLKNIQQQITTQNNFSRPSDAPFDVSITMQMQSSINANTQYGKNITNTSNWMQSTDTALSQIGDIYSKIRDDLVKAGNGVLKSDDLSKIKDEINQYISSLSGILNSNSQGEFIFGGTKGSSKPTGAQSEYITTKSNPDGSDVTISGDSTEASDTMYEIGVSSIDAKGNGNIEGVNCVKSTDGGKTWTSITPTFVSTNYVKIDGLDLKFSPNLNTKVNDTYTFSLVKNTVLSYNSSDNQTIKDLPPVVSDGFTASNWSGKGIVFNVNGATEDSKITLSSFASGADVDDVVKDINNKISANSDLKGKVLAQKTSDGKIRFDTLTNDTVFLKNSTVTSDLTSAASKEIPNIELSQIDSKRQTEISQGVLVQYNVSASDVINYGSGSTDNIIDLFKRIVNNLDGKDDTGALNSDAAQKAISGDDLNDLDKAITQILKVRSNVGSTENRMTAAQTQNSDFSTDMTDILSKTQKVDMTKVIMQYATAQTVYLASLQTSAKIIQPTLMDYLS